MAFVGFDMCSFMEKFLQCTIDISCFSNHLLNPLLKTSDPIACQFHTIFIMKSNVLLFHWAFIGNILNFRVLL